MKPLTALLVAFAFINSCLFGQNAAKAIAPGEWLLEKPVVEFPYLSEKKWIQPFYITSGKDSVFTLRLQLVFLSPNGDPQTVFTAKVSKINISAGPNALKPVLNGSETLLKSDPEWFRACQSMGKIPEGKYRYYIACYKRGTDQLLLSDTLLLTSDSLVTSAGIFGQKLSAALGNSKLPVTTVLAHKQASLERQLQKKGVAISTSKENGKIQMDLSCGKWYLGRYELPADETGAQFASRVETLKQQPGEMGKNALEGYKSMLSRFRELKEGNKEDKELIADLSVAGNFANDQEPNSMVDNNYYELKGMLSLPVLGIPIELSGYYTTQDRNRKAKSSYVHFRYDAEKAKEQMLKLITGFNRQYDATMSQGAGYKSIYGQFLSQLKQQQTAALSSLSRQYGIDSLQLSSLNKDALQQMLEQRARQEAAHLEDSLTTAGAQSGGGQKALEAKQRAVEAEQKAKAKYEQALALYQKYEEASAKIERYSTLLRQYEQASYYDSALAYSKMGSLKDVESMSYKDMAKKASAILPDGKAKTFIAGLTKFDAGMFSDYTSDYTMSGQMLKGVDAAYDVGIATLGGSYGKMEYIDREGNVEGYKSYSARIRFKPVMGQQFGFVYYGYSPGKQLLSDNGFFKDESVSLPSFRNPVHILSGTYNGRITSMVSLSGEYAFSNKPGQSDEAKGSIRFIDQSAYNIKADIQVPGTNITVETGYEHAGKNFENNTLPILLSGTDRLNAKVEGDFLKGFITLGAEYNYLLQQSFYSKGGNTRWGFDVATHSKRFPSLALSYKPFATFRSISDTLAIAQKPITGEVWTGKANYQIKRLDNAVRFTLVYNRNNSTNDTIRYQSSVTQLSTTLSHKTTMLLFNLGTTHINSDLIETPYPIYNDSWFTNVSLSGMVTPQLMLSGGTDLTKAGPGISKYGCFISSGYSFARLPFAIRTNFRFSNYRLTELPQWKQLYSGGIELTWRIREKL